MEFSKRISKIIKSFLWYIRRKYLPAKQERLSKGEALITSWLRYSNCKFTPQYPVYLSKLNTTTNLAFIDFIVNYKGTKYAIEFNGKQHYYYVPYFHTNGEEDLIKQQFRDKLVKEWCERHNMVFIEIPYTYTTDEIVDILKQYFD